MSGYAVKTTIKFDEWNQDFGCEDVCRYLNIVDTGLEALVGPDIGRWFISMPEDQDDQSLSRESD